MSLKLLELSERLKKTWALIISWDMRGDYFEFSFQYKKDLNENTEHWNVKY